MIITTNYLEDEWNKFKYDFEEELVKLKKKIESNDLDESYLFCNSMMLKYASISTREYLDKFSEAINSYDKILKGQKEYSVMDEKFKDLIYLGLNIFTAAGEGTNNTLKSVSLSAELSDLVTCKKINEGESNTIKKIVEYYVFAERALEEHKDMKVYSYLRKECKSNYRLLIQSNKQTDYIVKKYIDDKFLK